MKCRSDIMVSHCPLALIAILLLDCSCLTGCGVTIPVAIEGLSVLDLGSGAGHDSYVAAQLVGAHGLVTGVDMTPEQVQVARGSISAFTQQMG